MNPRRTGLQEKGDMLRLMNQAGWDSEVVLSMTGERHILDNWHTSNHVRASTLRLSRSLGMASPTHILAVALDPGLLDSCDPHPSDLLLKTGYSCLQQ